MPSKSFRRKAQAMKCAFRIVVVEDSETQAWKLRLLLEEEGYEVSTADDRTPLSAQLDRLSVCHEIHATMAGKAPRGARLLYHLRQIDQRLIQCRGPKSLPARF